MAVIYNGIQIDEYQPTTDTTALRQQGVDPQRPFVLFVGRITRQKGIIHLVNAIRHISPDAQVVLLAGATDTQEIAAEMEARVAEVQRTHANVVWVQEMLDKPSVIQFYSHAAVFCCPSIYEPFGIINLEAMACRTAVVASAVGGIKEVVIDGETGILVPLQQQTEAPFEPVDPERFAATLPAASTSCWRMTSCATRWRRPECNGPARSLAGRASPGRPSRCTSPCDTHNPGSLPRM